MMLPTSIGGQRPLRAGEHLVPATSPPEGVVDTANTTSAPTIMLNRDFNRRERPVRSSGFKVAALPSILWRVGGAEADAGATIHATGRRTPQQALADASSVESPSRGPNGPGGKVARPAE